MSLDGKRILDGVWHLDAHVICRYGGVAAPDVRHGVRDACVFVAIARACQLSSTHTRIAMERAGREVCGPEAESGAPREARRLKTTSSLIFSCRSAHYDSMVSKKGEAGALEHTRTGHRNTERRPHMPQTFARPAPLR